MINKYYMVTYTKEGNKNFSCVLVEATDLILAEKRFKAFKPDCELVATREESNPETYIKRGMSVLNDDLFNSIVEKMDKVILDDVVESHYFVLIAKVKNQREFSALKFHCGVEDDNLLRNPLPNFPFFVSLEFDSMEYTVRAVETIDSITRNELCSDVAYLYKDSKNRINDIQKLIYGKNYYDLENEFNKFAYSDEDYSALDQLAYMVHYGETKGFLNKHSHIRFIKEDVLEDKVLIDAYKKFYPENEYHLGVKSWRDKYDRNNGNSEMTTDYENLDKAFEEAFDTFKDNEAVEVIAIDNDHNEYPILYLGPDDVSDDDYGFGSMIVAELQDIQTMKKEGYLPEDY